MSALKNSNVFITGGNGFLGAHIIEQLLSIGARVACLVRKSSQKNPYYKTVVADRVTEVIGDLEDFDSLRAAVVDSEVVLHLGALKPVVGETFKNPLPAYNTNVRGTYNILEVARHLESLQAVVVVTTDKVYGGSPPHHENSPYGGVLPYEATKVCQDVIAKSFAASYKMPLAIARPANLYGPGDTQWTRIVPSVIRALLKNDQPILRSSSATRDYIYVGDVAYGIVRLVEKILQKEIEPGSAYNFGTGMPEPAIAIAKRLCAISGKNIWPTVVPGEVRGEILSQYLDCTKAKKDLQWLHKTHLAYGLQRTWKWYSEVL